MTNTKPADALGIHHIYRQDYSLRLEEMPIKTQEAKQSFSTWHPPVLRSSHIGFITYILFMLLPFISPGYASAQENILTLPIDSSQFANYYSEGYYGDKYYLRPEYEKMAIKFNSQEALVPRQEIYYASTEVGPGVRYYEIGRFFIDDYLYKLVAFGDYVEADTMGLIIQLNSYNSEGLMLDALILDKRWSYEGSKWFQQFKMKQNLINIDYYDISSYNCEEISNNLCLVKNPVPTIYTTAQYRINNGKFFLFQKMTYLIP